ncbi:hypothetical protein BLA29_015354 [Euroglyphus maynei]|uniref:Uncharacterized protein n=1 Tax=Euroglyphus maynei TaxID=6958 RepID=A0A1Y3BDJ6_EURMA|nr:hypothetical protein BLA29_015354 [Euroglyphus maynei]
MDVVGHLNHSKNVYDNIQIIISNVIVYNVWKIRKQY